MNKLLGTAVAAAFGLAMSACGGSGDNGGSGSPDDTLRVGIDLTYPPYDMLVDGEPAGFDVEFVDALAEQMNVEPSYEDTRFAQIIAGLKAGRFDMIASTLYMSAERAEEVDFVPYFQTGNAIIVEAGAAPLTTEQDLCGKGVGVVTATVIAKKMRGPESDACKEAGKPAIEVKEFPTDPEATQALLSGQVDAQMTDVAVAQSAVDSANDRLEITSENLIYPVAVGLGVEKGNTELADRIREGIEAMKESGTYDELLDKYGLEAPTQPTIDASMSS